MLTDTFHSIATAARKVLKNWKSMVLIAIVYAALLAALYFFMAVREASIVQVALTFGLAIAALVLFFLLHAMIAGGVAERIDSDAELSIGSLIRRSAANLWKLVVISLPLIAVAVLVAYLLGKAQNYFAVSPDAANDMLERAASSRTRNSERPPIDWPVATISSVRYLFFGLFLPLATIHLWLATVREGLWPAVRRIATHLSNAFAPQSVLIYIVGFLVFGLLPYLLLFKTTSTTEAWLEILLLVARLAGVFGLTLFGWVITVWALSLFATPPIRSQSEPATEAV